MGEERAWSVTQSGQGDSPHTTEIGRGTACPPKVAYWLGDRLDGARVTVNCEIART